MRPRLLIVDDQREIVDILSRYLDEKGYEVEGALDAEEAFGKLTGARFDIVLMDIELPGMNGLLALGDIVARAKAPVIMMTGHADSELEADAKALGAKGLFAKPLDFELLLKTFRDVLAEGARDQPRGATF